MGPMHAHAQASLPRRLESHKLLVRKAFLVHSLGAHVNVRARMRVCALCAVRERAVRCACVHVLARVRTRARSLSHADCCGTPARALCVSVLYAVRIVRCACPHACAQLVARGLLWHTHTHSHTGTHTHTHTGTRTHSHTRAHTRTRRFQAVLTARGPESVFRIMETNDFKQLPHITLAFRPGNDAAVKQVC